LGLVGFFCGSGLDAVVGDQRGAVAGVACGDAGGGDGVAALLAVGDFEVEVEELLQEVFAGGEAVGLEHGLIERGVEARWGV